MQIYGLYDSVEKPCFITPWDLIHFLSGIVFYLFFKYFNFNFYIGLTLFIIIHTLYEFKDLFYYFKITDINNYWTNNSLLNSIGDTFSAILGYILSFYIFKKINLFKVLSLSFFTIILAVVFKLYNLD
jgi:hypothetical protein